MNAEKLLLSDGSTILIAVAAATPQERDVAKKIEVAALTDALPAIKTFCQDIGSSLKSAAPNKLTVEFGLSFMVETSGLTALIAKGGAESNLTVTLEW